MMDSRSVAKKNAVQTKEDIIDRIERSQMILRGYGISRLGLFGSFVRGEQRQSSDVDFLVEFLPGMKTFDNFMNTSFFLEDLMGRRVDLVTPEGLSPYIGPHIMKELEYVSISA